LRRQSQLLRRRPDLMILPIRTRSTVSNDIRN
jgi:hypothetical protein